MSWFKLRRCAEGVHKFESLLVKSTPPSSEQLSQTTIPSIIFPEFSVPAIQALTNREYEIRCRWCGKKAG